MKHIVVISVLLLWSGVIWSFPKHCADPFSEQVARLINRIKMPKEELAAVPIILQDLELALGTQWPGSQIQLFGSMVTGLALVGSDIDAYVLLPDRSVRPHGSINYIAAAVLKRFPDYADIHPTFFYVTFKHDPSQKKIDLLFNNIEGGRNSALLGYLLNLDHRIKKLALIVKYWWAKVQKQAGYKMLPNYGMSVMLIFYLQQVNMLPPVANLQKYAEPFIYEGWNSGFDKLDYKPHNNASLYQLLGEYFEFYNNFKYDEYIISPFMGYPVKRDLFKDLSTVPREFKFYSHNIAKNIEMPVNLTDEVLVQDPVLHNKNLAVLVVAWDSSPFRAEFKRLAIKYRENNECAFLDEMLSVPNYAKITRKNDLASN